MLNNSNRLQISIHIIILFLSFIIYFNLQITQILLQSPKIFPLNFPKPTTIISSSKNQYTSPINSLSSPSTFPSIPVFQTLLPAPHKSIFSYRNTVMQTTRKAGQKQSKNKSRLHSQSQILMEKLKQANTRKEELDSNTLNVILLQMKNGRI